MIRRPLRRPRRLRLLPSARILLLAWILVPSMLLIDVAAAQFGQAAQIGRVMSPYYLRRDLPFIVDRLELDDGQSAIVEALYYDYEDAHLASQDRMKARFEEISETAGDLQARGASEDELFEVVLSPFVEQAEQWHEQRLEFLENVRAILSEPQMALWDEFLRALRRDKELPAGSLMGERVDLLVIARIADLPPAIRATVEPVLREYELALDAALVAREQVDLRNQGRLMRSMASPGDDALRMLRERIDASVGVRDVNVGYAARIRDSLPVEHADRFVDLYRAEAFPSIARPTAAGRIFEAALELETISEETRGAIDALHQAYRAELDPLVAGMIQVQLESEPEVERSKAEQFVNRTNAPTPFSLELNEARRQRTDLDRSYMKELQGLLNRSQFLSLPGASRFAERRERMLEPDARPEGRKRPPVQGGGRGGPGNRPPGGGGGGR